MYKLYFIYGKYITKIKVLETFAAKKMGYLTKTANMHSNLRSMFPKINYFLSVMSSPRFEYNKINISSSFINTQGEAVQAHSK